MVGCVRANVSSGVALSRFFMFRVAPVLSKPVSVNPKLSSHLFVIRRGGAHGRDPGGFT